MLAPLRRALPLALVLVLAACGKKADDSAPLAYVPADTAYVFASLEPLSEAVLEDRFRIIQPLWKPYFAQIDALMTEANAKATGAEEQQAMKIVRALLDEVRDRDSLAKWKELGFTGQARSALYGVGLTPVMRLELADPDAFRAFLGRVESKLGSPIPKAKAGDQEYWRMGPAEVAISGAMAIEGKQLVLTLLPKNATEATAKALLGVDRPGKNLADGDALQALAKERGYLPQGVGYVDVPHLFDLIAGEHKGVDAEFAAALQLPSTAIDPVCRTEIGAIAAHTPRATFGYTQFSTLDQGMAGSLDLDPALRQQLASVIVPVAGMGATDEAMMDFTLSLPLLKWKDFLLKQADAVAASPFKCEHLAKLNESFAEMKEGLDRTVPPPLSNFLGARFTLDRMTLGKDGMPDPAQSSGRTLIATDNPLLMISMAQLGAPPLKDLKLALDGKPVPLPAGAIPMPQLPAFVAANNSALALGVGAGADAALPGYLSAAPGDGKTLLHVRVSGAFYGLYGQLMSTIMARAGTGEHQELIDLQRQLYERYRDWMNYTDFSVRLTDRGLETRQSIRFNPPKP